MTDETGKDTAPPDPYQAANWVAERHPWARELARRVVGITEEDWINGRVPTYWIDDLAQAVLDHQANGVEWAEYELRTPPPPEQYDEAASERAYERWQQAGPKGTFGARAYGPMSSGEKRGIRLLATLSRKRVPWSVVDVEFDHRGALMLLDIQAVERAQLPAELFDPNYDPEAKWQAFVARQQGGEK